MQYSKIVFASFVFITAATLFTLFCSYANSQTITGKKLTSAQKEKQEIQKFAGEFIKSLEETKDLSQVPEKFFNAGFKTKLSQNRQPNWGDTELLDQLDATETYEYKVLIYNFLYLGMMWNCASEDFVFDEKFEETDDDETLEKLFPPQIVELVKKNKSLSMMFDSNDSEDYEIKSAEELRNLIIDLRQIVEMQRGFINSLPSKKNNIYIKNISKAREKFKGYKSELCEKEKCKGLPEKTRITQIAQFPFILTIIKENEELKIFNLEIYDE